MPRSSRDTDWAASVADFHRSGLTHVAFCRSRRIPLHSFRHWLFAQEILAAAAEPPSSPPPADTPAAAPQARPLQKNGHGRKPLPASLPRRRVLPAFASDFGEDWR